MGLSSFLEKLGRSKPKDNDPQFFPARIPARGDSLPKGNPATSADQRRARRQSIARPKTADNASRANRKSWFGRPVTRGAEDVPDLPKSMHLRNALGEEMVRPVTASSAVREYDFDAVKEKRKSRRLSISRSLSRKRSEPSMSLSRSYSTRTTAPDSIEALPPMPAMPAPTGQNHQASPSPAEQRLHRKPSQKGSLARKASFSRRFSRSFFTSSNPDESDDENVPPMPALVRSNTTTPDSGEETERLEQQARARRSSDSSSTHSKPSPPPLTAAVKVTKTPGYRPKSAGRAFLKTTSQASEAQRTLFRKSMGIVDGESTVGFSEQQAKEWEKLKALIEAAESSRPGDDDDEEAAEGAHGVAGVLPVLGGGGKGDRPESFANNQALAALEFNIHAAR